MAACGKAHPTAPTVPLNQQFTLTPGTSATVEGTALRVEFLRVSGDSRCPADAVCIQGGDAVVHVRVAETATRDYELHTGDSRQSAVTHAGFKIELQQLQPYPFSSRTIEPGEYRASFSVSR
jgi:hypothetical protein